MGFPADDFQIFSVIIISITYKMKRGDVKERERVSSLRSGFEAWRSNNWFESWQIIGVC